MALSGQRPATDPDSPPAASDRDHSAVARPLLLAVVVASLGTVGVAVDRPADDSSIAGASAGGALAGGAAVAPVGGPAALQSNGTESVALSVENVANCGSRCRLVTANLTNNGTERLENVTAETRIAADDARLWNRTYRFGNLSVNESANRTARIRLSVTESLQVARNDGWIRINTTVYWDGGNATFSERRRVIR
ncbi:hypothetical protein [Halosimplex salinum]|uniref:hypothetical protein n=1 Tax=Halosimplex salinum TaxID=1710538 RepID=UPI000F4925C3|nr:hypothetical protein [Halosimplex salinum]